jgi:hypothetical protein
MQFEMKVPLSYKKLDPVKGDIVEQLRIVPDITLAFSNSLIIAGTNGSVHTGIRIHAYKDIKDGFVTFTTDSTDRIVYEIQNFSLRKGADTLVTIDIPAGAVAGKKEYMLVPNFQFRDAGTLHLIQYNHLPALQYFTRPVAKVIQPVWKSAVKRIGYVAGAGDNIPDILRQAGLEVDMLKASDFVSATQLKKYDAIITGIRAVNAEKNMIYWMPVLLQYAENGGTLVVQYNTLQDMATTKLGPYPLTLSGKRVTEEDAKVTLTDPTHRLLNYPNKIQDEDFSGWVQERGLYFPSVWDSKYTPLFSMNDAGEQPLLGSTLYAKTGKGHYIYTALSFSRQLPAGNKGAIKLLMNMLSVGR